MRDAGWSLAGSLAPVLAALVFLPVIVAHMGVERFGLLSIALILSNYFGFLDFGAGRGLTRFVAERVGTSREAEIPALVSTGLALVGAMAVLSLLVCLALVPLAWLWARAFDAALQPEIRNGLLLVAVSTPLILMTNACRGVLEGFRAFRVIGLIQVPAGVALMAVPAFCGLISPRLDLAVAGLLVVRIVVLGAYLWPCWRQVRVPRWSFDGAWVRSLLHFGGWLTVSTVVGPIIVFGDRFLLGSMVSAGAVGFYAAPFEIASRVLLLPAALATAMLPALAGLHAGPAAGFETVRKRGAWLTFCLTVPLCVVGIFLAEPALFWWLGPEFARRSTVVLQILLVGFAFNGLAHLPLVALLAAGRARAVAFLHVGECLFYFPLLYALVGRHGLEGAALAWVVRAAFDWAALSLLAHRMRSVKGKPDA